MKEVRYINRKPQIEGFVDICPIISKSQLWLLNKIATAFNVKNRILLDIIFYTRFYNQKLTAEFIQTFAPISRLTGTEADKRRTGNGKIMSNRLLIKETVKDRLTPFIQDILNGSENGKGFILGNLLSSFFNGPERDDIRDMLGVLSLETVDIFPESRIVVHIPISYEKMKEMDMRIEKYINMNIQNFLLITPMIYMITDKFKDVGIEYNRFMKPIDERVSSVKMYPHAFAVVDKLAKENDIAPGEVLLSLAESSLKVLEICYQNIMND